MNKILLLLNTIAALSLTPQLGAAESPVLACQGLQIYTVTSNNMNGVLERFRYTVEPERRKHRIKTSGYWAGACTTNGIAWGLLAGSQVSLVLGGHLLASGLPARWGHRGALRHRRGSDGGRDRVARTSPSNGGGCSGPAWSPPCWLHLWQCLHQMTLSPVP